jgi:hypothetical protein
MDYVLLKCVKQGSKLRVQMMSSQPFVMGANCQFPRAIREEGTYYVVRAAGVKFKGTHYAAMTAGIIALQTKDEAEVRRFLEGLPVAEVAKVAVIFGDADENKECAICMTAEKDSVFAPCGHYVCCAGCAAQCQGCPICRAAVTEIVRRADIE